MGDDVFHGRAHRQCRLNGTTSGINGHRPILGLQTQTGLQVLDGVDLTECDVALQRFQPHMATRCHDTGRCLHVQVLGGLHQHVATGAVHQVIAQAQCALGDQADITTGRLQGHAIGHQQRLPCFLNPKQQPSAMDLDIRQQAQPAGTHANGSSGTLCRASCAQTHE